MEVLAGGLGKPFRHSIAVFHGHHGPGGYLNNKISRKTYYRGDSGRATVATSRQFIARTRLHSKRNRSLGSGRSGFPSSSISSFARDSQSLAIETSPAKDVRGAPIRGNESVLASTFCNLHVAFRKLLRAAAGRFENPPTLVEARDISIQCPYTRKRGIIRPENSPERSTR